MQRPAILKIKPLPEKPRHGFKTIRDARHDALHIDGGGVYGTVVGLTRVCVCGYHTRSASDFRRHLAAHVTVTHKLAATLHVNDDVTYACTCGYTSATVDGLQAHIAIEAANHVRDTRGCVTEDSEGTSCRS
ncbi:hypothetical protein H6A68_02805 [Bifidobacterium pullorum subsp. saeculare]|uniref:hypothetical protein n=1 Tax=Bifidobacterium pullorum TaxID=78448 RepID=UPI001956DBC2|nr:hypothetical protein [Bifidobacterium pullorum]MBM6705993.1 hypothetical protein [Bifidobacterium pullorum subsp. saeculare]